MKSLLGLDFYLPFSLAPFLDNVTPRFGSTSTTVNSHSAEPPQADEEMHHRDRDPRQREP